MVYIKLLIFASLKDIYQYDTQDEDIHFNMEQTHWPQAQNLKTCLLNVLHERWKLKNNQYNMISSHQQTKTIVNPNTIMLAINETYIDPYAEINLCQNDVVALIPPVTGG